MSSDLPQKPDFDAIEAVAHQSADRRTMILALIGTLSFCWSNNESMFIYVLMILMQTDQTTALLVFGTLNTTRARLELVQRLAKAKLTQKSVGKQLDKLIERFNEATRLRNELNHSLYSVNAKGEITHTHAMKIQEVKGKLRLGSTRKMDKARVQELSQGIQSLKDLNRDLWDFLPKLKEAMLQSPSA